MIRFGQYSFETMGQLAARQQYSPPAGQTFQADIGPQAHDLPVKSAAWVRLAQPNPVIHLDVRQHAQDYNTSVL
jgi:hypothetical protein